MPTTTTTYGLQKPTVGGDSDVWGGYINDNSDKLDDVLDGTLPITPAAGNDIDIVGTNAATNTVTTLLTLNSQSSGTPAAGIGSALAFAAETAAGNTEVGAVIEAVTTDVTSTSEDFDLVIKTMAAGAAAAERLRVSSSGVTTASLSATTALTSPSLTNAGTLALSATGANVITASTNGSERLRIDSSGNVGLGVTPSAWGSSFRALEANAYSLAGTTASPGTLYLSNNSFLNSSSQHIYKNTAAATLYTQAAGSHAWWAAPSGTAGAPITFTQAMTLDASGNLGLGATPSAWVTGGTSALELRRGAVSSSAAGPADHIAIAANAFSTGSNDPGLTTWTYKSTGAAELYEQRAGNHLWFNAASGTAGTAITFTENMRLGANGLLGIGTSSPAARVHIQNTDAGTNTVLDVLRLDRQTSGTPAAGIGVGMEFAVETAAGNTEIGAAIEAVTTDVTATSEDFDLVFRTMAAGAAAAERVRIDSSGNLLVNKTTATTTGAGHYLTADGAAGHTRASNPSLAVRRDTTDGQCAIFLRDGTQVGSISVTTTATAYNTSSDYRLKEDVQPMVGASDRVLALNPVNFAWKADGSRTDGFIAHEVQEVAPYAVLGEKDGEEMQAMDHSKLVPLLTAALQEALAKIASLEARVAALEA